VVRPSAIAGLRSQDLAPMRQMTYSHRKRAYVFESRSVRSSVLMAPLEASLHIGPLSRSSSLSCTSPSTCIVVGISGTSANGLSSFSANGESWSGTTWEARPASTSPDENVDAVSCTDNGHPWALPRPYPSADNSLALRQANYRRNRAPGTWRSRGHNS